VKLTRNRLKEIIRQSIKELDFKSQSAFDAYNKKHKMRKSTKVNVAGKDTTVGAAKKKDEPSGDTGGPSYANVPKGVKTSKQAEKVQDAKDKLADLKDRHKGSKYQLIDKLETMKKSEVDDIQSTLQAEKERLLQKATGKEDWGGPKFDNRDEGEAYWAAESAARDFYMMTHHYGDEVRYKPEDKEESITSKLKREFKESMGRKTTVKEIKKWFKTLEENRYKKTYNSDARRVSWLVNNSLSEDYDSMPVSMKKKWPKAAYKRERFLAREFMKHLKSKQISEGKLRVMVREIIKEVKNGKKS